MLYSSVQNLELQMKIEQINMFYSCTLLLTVTKHMAEFSFNSFNFSSKYSFIHENLWSSTLEHTSNHALSSSQSSPQIKDMQEMDYNISVTVKRSLVEIITVAFKFFAVHLTFFR
jgi:hypothetical protein